MPYVITELCIRDGACAEVCPVMCIHSTDEAPQFYIDPDICIECEQCVVVCPVDAVFLDVDLPPQYAAAEEANADFFRETKEPVEGLAYAAALEMIHAAEAYARRMDHQISVAIVDGAGTPIAVSRMDGATPWSSELALNKAYTATVYGIATEILWPILRAYASVAWIIFSAAAYESCSTGSFVSRKKSAFASSAASYCGGRSTSRKTASTGQTTTHCSHSIQMSGSI